VLLEQGYDTSAHGAPRVPSLGRWLPLGRSLEWRGTCGTSGGLRGSCGCLRRFLWCRAGQVEQALVLLVHLVQHGGQSGNMLAVVAFALLRCLELFTQDVHSVCT
jgi:hypothetical protein